VTEEAILKLISESFRSIWPLELLLVLSHGPRRSWQVDALVRELRASVPLINQGLDDLVAVKLVSADQDGKYRFQPASAACAEVACELIDLYNLKPRAVTRALYSAPIDRIQTFADAFRLRKPDADR
jgi:hypothetical protein